MLLHGALAAPANPTCVFIVSAFASLQAVLRLKHRLHELHDGAASIRVVIGVDMGGTSKEVLQELATWQVEVFIFKNRKGGVTFHPKLYIVETAETAEIFLGSNNLTEGGLYGNYEGAVRVTYQLPADAAELAKTKQQLSKFIKPAPPVSRRLDQEYLELLAARSDIPSAAEARQRRKIARGESVATGAEPDVFGFESTPGPPQLPLEVQQVVLAAIRHQLDELDEEKRARKAAEEGAQAAAGGVPLEAPESEIEPDILGLIPLAQIAPTAFYLELTATTGTTGKIPGEQRVPLEAINAAQEFWGWPDNYTESINPRKGEDPGGEERVYLNWKPVWRVRSISNPDKVVIKGVRMYYYKNSSDYRFYSGALAAWANSGDIVRITRCDNEPYVYDCALAVAGTQEHVEWMTHCSPGSGRSPRVFGFS